MVHSHNPTPEGWKICQDLWAQTQQNEQGSISRITAVLSATLFTLHHTEGHVILVTMKKKRSNPEKEKGQKEILKEGVDYASVNLAKGLHQRQYTAGW